MRWWDGRNEEDERGNEKRTWANIKLFIFFINVLVSFELISVIVAAQRATYVSDAPAQLNTDKRQLFYLEELIPFVCIRLQKRDDHPMHRSIGVSAIRMRQTIIYFNYFFFHFNFFHFCFVLKSTCDNFNCFRISKMANPDGKCAHCVCAVGSRTMWCNGARFCL